MQRLLFLCVVILSSAAAPSQVERPGFKEQVVDPNAGVGYAVTVADINHDGKTDIVVVTENPDQVVWYENPSWTRRIIVEGSPRLPVCIQPLDVDDDGKVELIDAKGLGCEDVICADLNGDGKVDIIGVGRSTKNVKVYWNEGKRR